MLKNLVEHVPIVGQAYGLTKTAMKVYNCTSPLNATVVAITSIVEDCSPPQIKYPIKCAVFGAQLVLIVISGGNPFTVALAVGAARQIIE